VYRLLAHPSWFINLGAAGAVPEAFRSEGMDTPRTGSFMHLHLGIDATGLPQDLDIHHLIVNRWGEIEVGGWLCGAGAYAKAGSAKMRQAGGLQTEGYVCC
jgi:hypothetical protein